MTFSNSVAFVMSGKYEMFGKLVQWSIANGGPGMPVLSPACYDLMTEVPHSVIDAVNDIIDHEAQTVIKSVSSSTVLRVSNKLGLCSFAFSALTLLVGQQEGHLACKN